MATIGTLTKLIKLGNSVVKDQIIDSQTLNYREGQYKRYKYNILDKNKLSVYIVIDLHRQNYISSYILCHQKTLHPFSTHISQIPQETLFIKYEYEELVIM